MTNVAVPRRPPPRERVELRPSDRGPGLLVGERVELPDSVEIGANVVIHAGTVIGAGCRLQDGAVLGKPLALARRSTARRDPLPPLELGSDTTVGSGAIVLSGVRVGERAMIGDRAHVRERTTIGGESVVGSGAWIDNDVTIGARVKVQTGAYITAFSLLEDDVFVAPGVITTNDDAMGRHSDDEQLEGVTFRRACRVGGRVVLLPGTVVGEEAFVAAGSVVTRSVPARTLVMGVPARAVRDVRDDELIERWS